MHLAFIVDFMAERTDYNVRCSHSHVEYDETLASVDQLSNLRKPVLIPMILRVEELRALEVLMTPICGFLIDAG